MYNFCPPPSVLKAGEGLGGITGRSAVKLTVLKAGENQYSRFYKVPQGKMKKGFAAPDLCVEVERKPGEFF